MERALKKEFVDTMHAAISGADIVILSHNKGLTVAEVEDLRKKMVKAGASYKVTKNRLTKRALEGTSYVHISDMFRGPVAISYASNDPVSVSKVVTDFAKNNEKFVILGGALGDRPLKVKDIEALSQLPSLNELRAKIVGMLKTPATRIACILQAPGGQVARVISAHAKQG